MGSNNRSRSAILIALAAAAGAFGVAAMMSAATAPTARADDLSEIISVLDANFATGQADIAAGFADLASHPVDGLSSLFLGVEDEFVVAPEYLFAGTVEALTNEPISGSFNLAGPIPTDFAEGLADAQTYISTAQSSFSEAATEFAAGEYGLAVVDDAYGVDFISILPLQELILGAAASL